MERILVGVRIWRGLEGEEGYIEQGKEGSAGEDIAVI
jgi:hypothetical protein